MDTTTARQLPHWLLWQKTLFRFLFVFLVLAISPWYWMGFIPGLNYLLQVLVKANVWLVQFVNDHLLHIRTVLVMPNGSGDTSLSWAGLCTCLLLAFIGCIIWSVLDRKRLNYTRLNYWLCVLARYYIIFAAFIYGFNKLFCLQMPWPNLHQMATPLGDFLPMRLSWMFLGSSPHYEMFSGVAEILAGALLLYRRTATLGALVALAVFANVMMLNLCYDIPVKIYSTTLTLTSLFLLANESERLGNFLILNKPAAASTLYQFTLPKQWMRVTKVVFKTGFIVIVAVTVFKTSFQYYRAANKPWPKQAIKNGVYEVTQFSVNKKILPLSITDSTRWQDVIFENGLGSVNAIDPLFRQSYHRSYFSYTVNDTTHTILAKRSNTDAIPFMILRYVLADTNMIKLSGTKGADSIYVELKRTKRHFQLAEKQFHWVTEQPQ